MAKCLCSNDLNRYVTVKRIKSSATINGAGHVDETVDANWETVGNEWCQILTKGSREFRVGDQLNQGITHQVTMRYSTASAAYTANYRIEFESRKLYFAGPPMNLDEGDMWIVVPAMETPPV